MTINRTLGDWRPPDAQGWVLELDGLWFLKPSGEVWHLTKPTGLTSWCGLRLTRHDKTRVIHVTYPWITHGCWSCMDRRWAKEIR